LGQSAESESAAPPPDAPWKRRIGKHVVRMRERGDTFEEIYWSLIEHRIRRPNGKEWSLGTLKRYFNEELQLRADLKAYGRVKGIPEESET
jgi:hypothetical protein